MFGAGRQRAAWTADTSEPVALGRWLPLVGTRWLDLAACLALLVVALAMRLPGLMLAPYFTDETEEIRRAALIGHGRLLTLVNVDSYIGAWHNYLTAGAFLLFGFDVAVARALTLVFGLLAVLATYWLARELGLARPMALAAAGIVALSGAHAVVGSRVAWSNCTTPFYSTAAFALLAAARRRNAPQLLPPAGFVAGLALLTHPSALPLVLALGIAGLRAARRAGWLRTAWPPLAVGLFLVAYSPIIGYNLAHDLASVQHGMRIQGAYESGRALSPAVYADNLGLALLGLGQLLASDFGAADGLGVSAGTVLGLGLGLAALAWAARRGLGLLVLPVVALLLFLPLFNHKYNLVMNGRYLMPLLPCIAVAEAALLTELVRRVLARDANDRVSAARLSEAGIAVALLGWLLVSPPLRQAAYERGIAQAPHNGVVLDVADSLADHVRPGEVVVLDRGLRVNPPGYPGFDGRFADTVGLVLTLRDVPYRYVTLSDSKGVRLVREWAAGRSVLYAMWPNGSRPAPGLRPLPDVGDNDAIPADAIEVYRLPSGDLRHVPAVRARSAAGATRP